MQRAAPIVGDSYTLVAYVRIDAVPGDSRPSLVAVNAGLTQFEGLEIRSTGAIRFHYVDGSGYSQLNTFVSMSLDTWWAVAFVRDGDDFNCYIREDGGSTQDFAVNTSQSSRDDWDEIRFRFPVTSHNEETGYQLTRLFDMPLSQAEIEDEWDSITPVNTTDLVADWEFENDGTSATRRNDAFATYDLSGTSDTDWGASDLPAVFGSGSVDLAPLMAQGASASVALEVRRLLAPSMEQAAAMSADLRVERLLSASMSAAVSMTAGIDIGVFAFPARYQLRAGLVDTRPRISR